MNGKPKSVGCTICEICSDCLVLNPKSSLYGHTIWSSVTVWAFVLQIQWQAPHYSADMVLVSPMFSDMGSSLF